MDLNKLKFGELLIADLDGCTKVPLGMDPNKIANIGKTIQIRELEGKRKILKSLNNS